jgi:hypothetical protein
MTATAIAVPQDLASRSWSSLLRLLAIIAVFVMLAVGSFAAGRSTADTGGTKASAVPASTTPAADTGGCSHTANTPPC